MGHLRSIPFHKFPAFSLVGRGPFPVLSALLGAGEWEGTAPGTHAGAPLSRAAEGQAPSDVREALLFRLGDALPSEALRHCMA